MIVIYINTQTLKINIDFGFSALYKYSLKVQKI